MENLSKPMKLSPEVNRVLEEIRKGAENALYCAEPAAADKLFHEQVESLIEGAGPTSMQVIHYRWFLREVARLWRTRQGRDLAFHLELSLRKWRGLGLEPRTLQFLVCECHERLKGKDLAAKSQRHEENQDDSTTKTQSQRESEHSIPLSLDPSIPSASTTKTPRHEEGSASSLTPGPSSLAPDFSFPGCMSGPRPPARKPHSGNDVL
jgi:hypothetical protein